jgi:tRNA G46 methylase TrmB
MENSNDTIWPENLSKELCSNNSNGERFSKIFTEDENFDSLYPSHVGVKSARNWTKLEVAKLAADFLATEKNVHVLDIGSGVGKFCITAAHFKPHAIFYGVEQRRDLVDYLVDCSNRFGLYNVSFIHGNFTQLDLRQFDHFYFYNSFYENIVFGNKFIEDIDYSEGNYSVP